MLQERTSSILTRRTVQFLKDACRVGFLRRFYERHKIALWISGGIVLFAIVYLAPSTVIFVGAGKAGVLYETFGRGTRTDVIYPEGAHVIWPWDRMTIYDVRINETTTRLTIMSANGLDIGITLSIRFYPRTSSLGLLHQQAGPAYVAKIVVPEIQSIVRNLCANFEPEQIYRTQPSLDQSILEEASRRLGERFIVLDAVLIQAVDLPAPVQAAIQTKLVAQQAGEEMKYKIEKEAGEKQRKLIEAEGIRLFNATIQATLSDEVLRYRGIEALREMAKSARSNTLFLGASDSLRYLLDPSLGRGIKGPAPSSTLSPQ